jgi:membrane protein insertase Oxa1/YidC/SpoIIIJ
MEFEEKMKEIQEKIEKGEKLTHEDIHNLYDNLKTNDTSNNWLFLIVIFILMAMPTQPTKVTNIYLGDD